MNCSSDVDPDVELEWIELCIGAQRWAVIRFLLFLYRAVLSTKNTWTKNMHS